MSVKQQRGEGNRFAGNLYTINIKIPAVFELVNDPQRKISATEGNASKEPWQEKPCTDISTTGEEPQAPMAVEVKVSQEGSMISAL